MNKEVRQITEEWKEAKFGRFNKIAISLIGILVEDVGEKYSIKELGVVYE